MRVDANGPAIEDLRTFLLLSESVGVAEVARRLGVDVSVVSRRLRPFRERHGLLRKQGGSLVLTDRGRDLLPTIRAVLGGYDGLVGQLHRVPGGATLTIAAGGFGAAVLIPEVVARLSAQDPKATVRVRVCRGRERIVGMVDGRFDLAVVSHSLEQIRATLGDADVEAEPLPGRPFVVVARRDATAGLALGILSCDAAATIRDLSAIVLVGLDETAGVRTQLERRAIEAGVRLRFGASGGGWMAAVEYARHGLGAAIVPAEALGDDDARTFAVRRLDRSLSPVDHVLHRPAEVSRVGLLRTILVSTAADQCRRQQERVGQLAPG